MFTPHPTRSPLLILALLGAMVVAAAAGRGAAGNPVPGDSGVHEQLPLHALVGTAAIALSGESGTRHARVGARDIRTGQGYAQPARLNAGTPVPTAFTRTAPTAADRLRALSRPSSATSLPPPTA